MIEVAEQLDTRQVAGIFHAAVRDQIVAECEQLELAALWADHHPADGLPKSDGDPFSLVGERAMRPGGPGTPEVAEFAAAELAPEAGLPIWAVSSLIADALNLRHRLPLIWGLVQTARVRAWVARKVAVATQDLSVEQAGRVDELLVGKISNVGGKRLSNLIKTALLQVDAERMAKLAEKALRARGVHVGQANEHGITRVTLDLDAPDALILDAQTDRMARILMNAEAPIPGVPDRHAQTLDEWRSVAAGVLGNPLLAARILIEQEQPELFDAFLDLQEPFGSETAWPHTHPSNYPANEPDLHPTDLDAEPPEDEPPLPEELPPDDLPPAGLPPAEPSGYLASDRPGGSARIQRGDSAGDWSGDVPAAEWPSDASGTDGPADAPGAERPSEQLPVVEPPDDCEDQAPPPPDEPVADPNSRDQRRQRALRELLRAIDPARIAPPVLFRVHCTLSDFVRDTTDCVRDTTQPAAIARVESLGPVLLRQARDWFAAGTRIRLQPVIDVAGIQPVDAYEIPPSMREALLLRTPASAFPNSTSLSRSMDADHSIAYRRNRDGTPAAPGQTGLHNLGPGTRPEHRFKTFGRVAHRQPVPGTYVWRTITGRLLIVNDFGTHDLGTGPLADRIWHAVAGMGPPRQPE